ncbi:polymorphic toxin-type HINT domain-containing protein [Paenibacillus thiaminolyticus]|uniref:polymorphic toxin-type HINT domain-containing protein n=1 Tax=Paenibacillus thiaminolyticus TaxID=49283 RepID=UPI0035A62837
MLKPGTMALLLLLCAAVLYEPPVSAKAEDAKKSAVQPVHSIDLARWGIRNDGTQPAQTTKGINDALEWAGKAGITAVSLPPGEYAIDKNSRINMVSNMTFQLTPDVILQKEPNDKERYDLMYIGYGVHDVTLLGGGGATLAIDKIEKEPREATVYNFQVQDFHSYFVSNLGIWVHNCLTWTGKGFNNIGKNNSANDLIKNLEDARWTKTIESGGKKSGDATIFVDPTTGTKVRIHATPGEGTPYFRVQNKGGGYLNDDGVFPSNATKQELRDQTHFYFRK